EMLRELRDHAGYVGGARRVYDQYARSEPRELFGYVVQIRSVLHRRAARRGLLDCFDQLAVPAEHQQRRLAPVRRGWLEAARVIDLLVHFVRAVRHAAMLRMSHGPLLGFFVLCPLILTYARFLD